jgi:hypothetical protein
MDYFHRPLDQLSNKLTPVDSGAGIAADIATIMSQAPGSAAGWAQYLSERSNKELFAHTLEGFVDQYADSLGISRLDDPTRAQLRQNIEIGLMNIYIVQNKIFFLDNGLNPQSDFTDVDGLDGLEVFTPQFDLEKVKSMAVKAFTNFITHFPVPYPDNGDPPLTVADFELELRTYFTTIALIELDTTNQLAAVEGFPSFEEIYKGMFPDATEVQYITRLNDFVNQMIRRDGTFIPSQHVDEWQTELRKELDDHLFIKLSPDEIRRRNIMMMVFRILRQILERLQETIFVQGENVQFLTEEQNAYTELMARIPIYQSLPAYIIGEESSTLTINSVLDPSINTTLSSADSVLGSEDDDGEDNPYNLDTGDGVSARSVIKDGVELSTAGIESSDDENYQSIKLTFSGDFGSDSDAFLDAKGFAGITMREILEKTDIKVPGVWFLAEQPYDGTGRYGTAEDDQTTRSDINAERNRWIESARSFRNISRDRTKQAQTNLSQTKEAINQQTNLMTSLIQQLSGMLQSIFRG